MLIQLIEIGNFIMIEYLVDNMLIKVVLILLIN